MFEGSCRHGATSRERSAMGDACLTISTPPDAGIMTVQLAVKNQVDKNDIIWFDDVVVSIVSSKTDDSNKGNPQLNERR